jgi:hypothetical protein
MLTPTPFAQENKLETQQKKNAESDRYSSLPFFYLR